MLIQITINQLTDDKNAIKGISTTVNNMYRTTRKFYEFLCLKPKDLQLIKNSQKSEQSKTTFLLLKIEAGEKCIACENQRFCKHFSTRKKIVNFFKILTDFF